MAAEGAPFDADTAVSAFYAARASAIADACVLPEPAQTVILHTLELACYVIDAFRAAAPPALTREEIAQIAHDAYFEERWEDAGTPDQEMWRRVADALRAALRRAG